MKYDPLHTMRVLLRPSPPGVVGAVTATSVTTLTSDDTNVNEANHVVATPILGLFPSSPLRHFTLWLTFFLTRILKIIIGFVDKLIQSQ